MFPDFPSPTAYGEQALAGPSSESNYLSRLLEARALAMRGLTAETYTLLSAVVVEIAAEHHAYASECYINWPAAVEAFK